MMKKKEIDQLLQEGWSLRQHDAAQSHLLSQQARDHAESSGYERGLLTAYRNLSDLHIRVYEYESALILLEHASTLLQKSEHAAHPAVFDLYLQASNVHMRLGNTPESLAYCYKAEVIAQAEANLSRQGYVYKTIGNIQMLSGKHKKAIAAYEKAQHLFVELDDIEGILTIFNNMCHTYHQCNQYDEALRSGLAGLQLFEAQGEAHNLSIRLYGYNLNNVGVASLKLGRHEAAVGFFEKAAVILQQENDLYGEVYSLRGLAEVNLFNQKYEQAFILFKQALAVAEKSGIATELVKCHIALANAYKETRNFQQALFHYEKFYESEKSIINDETEKKIRNLEATYKIQKAEQEMQLYQLRNVALGEEIEKRKKAEQAATAAARAKSEFLANMSHEIRTPLNGIIGVVDLLQSTSLNKQQQELMHIIQGSGDSLLRIINDILDFSKIEAGKLQLENIPYSLRQAVESTVDLLLPKALEKQLEIGYIMEPDVPQFIVGDVTRFQQILINLLGNGIKFTEQGDVFVRIKSRLLDAETAVIQVTVEDTGIGISGAELDQMFQSFSQVDASITRKYGGTGLGLAISKQLAGLMGGRMWVESVPEQGSAFHFTIRAKIEILDDAEGYVEENRLAGLQFLLITSHDNSRLALENQMAALNTSTVASDSVAEAFALVQQHNFAAILMTYPFNKQAEVVALSQLEAALKSNTPPLLAIVPRGATAPPALFAEMLTKPVKLSYLRYALQQILINHPQQETQSSTAKKQLLAEIHPLMILIVEDNEVNKIVAQKILRRLGYEAEVVENGLEAVNLVEKRPFDLILMDIQMPKMDGVTATQEIHKRFTEGKRPYIIAMTANALKGDRERFLEAGLDDYLSKPIRLETMTDALRSVPSSSRA